MTKLRYYGITGTFFTH